MNPGEIKKYTLSSKSMDSPPLKGKELVSSP